MRAHTSWSTWCASVREALLSQTSSRRHRAWCWEMGRMVVSLSLLSRKGKTVEHMHYNEKGRCRSMQRIRER